ncbi:ATP-binding protein [Kordia algicida OT-1]|uniref:histidine kinase n=1 Tax=Kordia algicida OT-1 TaxID=391587 RepID=A9DKR3_9FLAO|nr:ATP-binding protein [Kordia algicida]EDP98383.1 Periplasmic Sensor Signal Transduction Histidine Kinase [Kordia algicida OT-1]
MKLLPATSFFFLLLSIIFIACESRKEINKEISSDLVVLKKRAYQKSIAKEYDSAIFYAKKLLKISTERNDEKFTQVAYDRLSRTYVKLEIYDSAIYYGHKILQLSIDKDQNSTIKKAYDKLSRYHGFDNNYDSAIYYGRKLYDLANKSDDTLGLAKASYKLGHYRKEIDSFKLSYDSFVESKKLFLKINDSVKVAEVLLRIAEVEKASGNYGSSQSSSIEGLQYLVHADEVKLRSKFYYTIAVAAKEQGNLKIAEKRVNEALDLAKDSIAFKKIGKNRVINYRNTKANIFKEKGELDRAINIYESLLKNDFGKLIERDEARINANLAHTLFLKDGFNKRSDSLLKFSLSYYKKGNPTREMISTNMKLAELNSKRDKQKATYYIEEVEKYAKILNNKKSLYEAQQLKIRLFPNYKNIERYLSLEREVNREDKAIETEIANAKFDVEEEENKTIKADNERIKAENKANKFYNFILWLSLILIIIIVLVFIIYNKIKRQHKIEKVKTVHVTEARISSKVHDELANDLYKLISQLETTDPEKEVILDKLDLIYNQARDISKQIQRINTSKEFPSELNNLFRSYRSEDVNVLLKRYDIDIWNGISSHVKATIYRVLQELLTNMKKHSNATLVVVSIEKLNKQLFIQYIDNGKGFSEEISKNGLQNAENRIHAIQGKLTFDTELHKGCKFSINVPV